MLVLLVLLKNCLWKLMSQLLVNSVLAGIAFAGASWSSVPQVFEINLENSPGLYCRTIALAMVYGEASLSSRVLGRTQNFIAVTGKGVNGFLPIVTGSGVRGWVMTNQVYPENGSPGPCRVQLLPNGRLLFGWP